MALSCGYTGSLARRSSSAAIYRGKGIYVGRGGAADYFAKRTIFMKIIEKDLSEIRPYENNPRNNEVAVSFVANSLREFGWKQPIVIDKDGVIVAGHTRYKAALSLGWTKAPCLIADDLTDEQIRAYRLADNKTGEAAEWDFSALEAELDAIDMDMEQFGFLEDEEENEKNSEKESESIEEQFQLIIDCTSEEDMKQKYDTLREVGIECRVSTL